MISFSAIFIINSPNFLKLHNKIIISKDKNFKLIRLLCSYCSMYKNYVSITSEYFTPKGG
ncbi:hypothetical protein TPHV1_210028 [Treponema phagedenis]|uniref:Uncharacterized protein n=1 Tax=Treponema phagedenis TaxID=162 RepID=A0A0B7GXV3_TREPH|nr:hypothetical protein TPHV1_210028 [Treponema phagedenis]